uniref:Uncharacterized protein n=1 Tax=Arion vulgaris TaxID=1028688 RepID=A0A0B7B6Q1_9EUPU
MVKLKDHWRNRLIKRVNVSCLMGSLPGCQHGRWEQFLWDKLCSVSSVCSAD